MKKSPSIYAILIIVTLSIQICFSKLISESVAYQEAPMLAAEVKAGKLPAVDKRLPTSPVVVQPVDKIGDYGGIWRRSYTGLSDLSAIRKVLYDPLVRWTPDFKIAPNLCASWEISNNGAKYTFHLVKGIRWSDGTDRKSVV